MRQSYNKYILDNKNVHELKHIKIIRYELYIFNFEKKLELINIYKKYKSEYYIEKLLEGLYEKKIIHMNNLIQ